MVSGEMAMTKNKESWGEGRPLSETEAGIPEDAYLEVQ